MRRRRHWRRVNDRLDPVRDAHEISLNLTTHEFPWDILQALSFALLRTFAVPSIGGLLSDTGEFTGRVQKRYDDTGLLLEQVQEHGFLDPRGRDAVRRINQMHAMYDISNEDLRYVLSTFVVAPKRWIDSYAYRPLTDTELRASVHYYRELARHMAIQDVPETYDGFAQLMDDYERAHFAYDAGGRAVADATIELFTTFPLNRLAPKRVLKRFVVAIMDEPLRRAFGYPQPGLREEAFFRGLLRARGRAVRFFPARSERKFTRDFGYFRSYPGGFRTEDLGTFTPGCPVHRDGAEAAGAAP